MPERRAIQSVSVHLISLCAALERDWPAERAPGLIRRALEDPQRFRWLDPVPPIGSITVERVVRASSTPERARLARSWAEDLWSAYSRNQDEVRAWLDDLSR